MAERTYKLPCAKTAVEWVVWLDAIGRAQRAPLDEIDNRPAVNCTLGWPIAENEDCITYAYGDSTSGELDTYTILVANIVDRVPVVPRRRRKAAVAPE